MQGRIVLSYGMTKQTSETPVRQGNTTLANGSSPFSFALHSSAGESAAGGRMPPGTIYSSQPAEGATPANAMASAAMVLGAIALVAVVIAGRRRS